MSWSTVVDRIVQTPRLCIVKDEPLTPLGTFAWGGEKKPTPAPFSRLIPHEKKTTKKMGEEVVFFRLHRLFVVSFVHPPPPLFLDVVNRIMRKDNYMVALFGFNVIPLRLRFPRLRFELNLSTKATEWAVTSVLNATVFAQDGTPRLDALDPSERYAFSFNPPPPSPNIR
jgi:hypothetical protein